VVEVGERLGLPGAARAPPHGGEVFILNIPHISSFSKMCVDVTRRNIVFILIASASNNLDNG
jgi:hypothetical protein